MVVERYILSLATGEGSFRASVSKRVVKRAQMLMSVGLGRGVECPLALRRGRGGGRGASSPREPREGRRETNDESQTRGVSVHAHPRRGLVGGRMAPWATRGVATPDVDASPGDGSLPRRRRRVPSVPRRDVARGVAPITVRMEQLAQFVSKSFDNAAAAAAAGVEAAAAGCRSAAGGRITLSVAHLIGDRAVDDDDRRTCKFFPSKIHPPVLFMCRFSRSEISLEVDAVRAFLCHEILFSSFSRSRPLYLHRCFDV